LSAKEIVLADTLKNDPKAMENVESELYPLFENIE
jgi:hypothetical protein